MNNEPVVAGFTVTAMLTAVVNLLVAFDIWEPTADQIATLTTFVIVLSSVAAAIIVRSRVTPTAKLGLAPPAPPQASAGNG